MYKIETPDKIYGRLFEEVQGKRLFKDSKQFVDAIPKSEPATILASYEASCQRDDFDLKNFVVTHFDFPEQEGSSYSEDAKKPVREHIESLWDVLSRQADSVSSDISLIPLPKPYIVPGGRFREIYYWDSYFTMLGQAASGRIDMLESMVENFAYLIDKLGFIPNGNRSYFCSRSQPPFFALMIKLLADKKDDPSVYIKYLTQLEKEYAFWMDGCDSLEKDGDSCRRVIKVGEGFLNRYWDDSDKPRQESYFEDLELVNISARNPDKMYRDIRAACESGWDFTSRWFSNYKNIESIRTSDIVPVDLNSLLYFVEDTLAQAYKMSGDLILSQKLSKRATIRRKNIQELFFDSSINFFCDIVLPDFKHSSALSLASIFPLFFRIASSEQAALCSEKLEKFFLKSGGWVTTLNYTGQQWDAPNGWAPLQWIVYRGLCNYGFDKQAQEGAKRWVDNNLYVYNKTGQLAEKYNVEEIGVSAEGGEYVVQHGFGWTNGVLLQMMNELGLD
ncbi:alpha,alpha-trehalase TreF [Agarilytica rhodophyticola]|uniref:alpha,alpha-trehalase TreF n=1 Tax=Agarilytica rhodophyticola TaxID=1737490 RepID=UPI000B3495A6|nr:alpha,alpha-trehalase TreF [Agarilytica rhodophyticola]